VHAAIALVLGNRDLALPPALRSWLETAGLRAVPVRDEDELMRHCLRGRPRLVIIDGRTKLQEAARACDRLKGDSYTAVVPAVLVAPREPPAIAQGLRSGADEVIAETMAPVEFCGRLDMALRRSDRDVWVHPSTRLAGTAGIEAEIVSGIERGVPFAVCYADLDHFKEYNDRYSYADGDRVIQVLARILHDVVKGLCGEQGFVGHIGGDDFIFIIPSPYVDDVCREIIQVFDLLVPFQYSEADRRAGYFFGKDRRGQLHRVPLMTVSIGVVSSERRHFTTASQVSELATEMKSYAKTLPGSVYVIDRRQDHVTPTEPTPGAAPEPMSAADHQ
jgi:GGDEF domain-containing protein